MSLQVVTFICPTCGPVSCDTRDAQLEVGVDDWWLAYRCVSCGFWVRQEVDDRQALFLERATDIGVTYTLPELRWFALELTDENLDDELRAWSGE